MSVDARGRLQEIVLLMMGKCRVTGKVRMHRNLIVSGKGISTKKIISLVAKLVP